MLFNKIAEIKTTNEAFGTGWIPPVPDLRDYTDKHPDIESMTKRLGITSSKKMTGPPSIPPSIDLRPWCSPIENQGNLGSCTAHAGVGID